MTNNPSFQQHLAESAKTENSPSLANAPMTPDVAAASKFLAAWDSAWEKHDPQALGLLHTTDAVTVNRFGTVVESSAAIEKALAFLHNNDGPFSRSTFPALQIIGVRQVTSEVMILQTKWQNPFMNSDGTIDPGRINDVIVTFVLVRFGSEWKATQVDAHNVDRMNLPFANAGQKNNRA